MSVQFFAAKPVFADGLDQQMNVQLGFYAYIPAVADAVLRLCGTTSYQIYVNGAFFRSGPARTCHGKFRVDELDLSAQLMQERNAVVILLQSSYCNSFVVPRAPGFLQAEIVSGSPHTEGGAAYIDRIGAVEYGSLQLFKVACRGK